MRLRRVLYLERRDRGSTRAFGCAVGVARDHGAEVTLAGARARRRERILQAAELLDAPVRVSGEGGAGIPWSEVRSHDLVVTVGPRRRKGPIGRDPFIRSLVRECRCPVWVLHPAQGPEVRTVLAAVDLASPGGSGSLDASSGGSGGPDGSGEARRVLRVVRALWGGGRADVYAVHCWSLMGESMLASRTRGGSRRGARQVREAAERSRRRRLERLLEAEGFADGVAAVLRKAGVTQGLRDAAWHLEADVVVVGWTDRTWLGELVLGHSAERLIGRVPSSVLVVRSSPERESGWPAADAGALLGGAAGAGGRRVGRTGRPSRRVGPSAARSVH